jgi:hypothetical protein
VQAKSFARMVFCVADMSEVYQRQKPPLGGFAVNSLMMELWRVCKYIYQNPIKNARKKVG